jgi:hypothetical protein
MIWNVVFGLTIMTLFAGVIFAMVNDGGRP